MNPELCGHQPCPKSSACGPNAITPMNLPFKKGEKVVYPAHGVAVIEDIQMRVISGTERRFYMLRILGTEKMTIMIPTENVESVGLWRLSARIWWKKFTVSCVSAR